MLTRLQEKLLLKFSKTSSEVVQRQGHSAEQPENALALLERLYTNFSDDIKNKLICDFGCGIGQQSIALALAGAKHVLGVDINPRRIAEAKKIAATCAGERAGYIEFSAGIQPEHKGQFDIVISQNSMEHFSDPGAVLDQMRSLLNADGRILITFGPPWYAPYGAHMRFFTNLPWVQLIFSERAIMNVRKQYRQDGAEKFEQVESGLNKMSIAKFERIIKESGLKIVFKNYQCLKGLDFMGHIPVIRELFINHVSVALALVDVPTAEQPVTFPSRLGEFGLGVIIPGFSPRGRTTYRVDQTKFGLSRWRRARHGAGDLQPNENASSPADLN